MISRLSRLIIVGEQVAAQDTLMRATSRSSQAAFNQT
jgi:hypothetical protein